MADKTITGGGQNQDLPVKWHDNGDGTYSQTVYATIPGGGGSAVSISDGSDVAEGTTTDPAWVTGAGTVIAILKRIANSAGGGTQYAEDSVHASGDLGTGALVVRKDTATQLAGTDGDYSLLVNDASGRLHTNVGTSALPTGAATAAKQPAIGTAGSASADVLTVQGVTSMTALKVDGSGVTQPVSGTVSLGSNQSVNVTQLAGTATDTNSGAKSAGTLRVTLATDQVQLTNALKVDGSATTQPVSGTVTASGPVTDTQLRATPVPVSGTVTANAGTGTLAVSAAALPLPAGAATAAKQPAIGAAGTASTDVITMQGIAGGTPIPVTGAGGGTQYVEDVASVGGETMTLAGAIRQDTLSTTTSTDGDYANLKVTATGALYVSGPLTDTQLRATPVPVSGTVTATTGGLTDTQLRATPVPISGALTANQSVNQAQISGTATAVNSGALSAGVQRVTLATDQVQLTNALKVDGSAVTQPVSGTISVSGTMPTNQTQVAGTAVDVNSGTKSAGTLRVTLATDQVQLTNALKVDPSAVTSPVSLASVPSHAVTNVGTFAVQAATELSTGLTTFSNTALSNTKTAVKAAAGKVHGWMVHNPSAATAFIQVWNVAIASITVGTTAPTWTIPLPAGASANVFTERGVTHSTEINVAATTTATGSTAPATALVVSIFYI